MFQNALRTKRGRFSFLISLPAAVVGAFLGLGLPGPDADREFAKLATRTRNLESHAAKLEAEGATMDDPQYRATKNEAIAARAQLEEMKATPFDAGVLIGALWPWPGLLAGMFAGFFVSFACWFAGLSLVIGMVKFVWKG